MSSRMVAFPDMSASALRAFFGDGQAEIVAAGETWHASLDGRRAVLQKAAER